MEGGGAQSRGTASGEPVRYQLTSNDNRDSEHDCSSASSASGCDEESCGGKSDAEDPAGGGAFSFQLSNGFSAAESSGQSSLAISDLQRRQSNSSSRSRVSIADCPRGKNHRRRNRARTSLMARYSALSAASRRSSLEARYDALDFMVPSASLNSFMAGTDQEDGQCSAAVGSVRSSCINAASNDREEVARDGETDAPQLPQTGSIERHISNSTQSSSDAFNDSGECNLEAKMAVIQVVGGRKEANWYSNLSEEESDVAMDPQAETAQYGQRSDQQYLRTVSLERHFFESTQSLIYNALDDLDKLSFESAMTSAPSIGKDARLEPLDEDSAVNFFAPRQSTQDGLQRKPHKSAAGSTQSQFYKSDVLGSLTFEKGSGSMQSVDKRKEPNGHSRQHICVSKSFYDTLEALDSIERIGSESLHAAAGQTSKTGLATEGDPFLLEECSSDVAGNPDTAPNAARKQVSYEDSCEEEFETVDYSLGSVFSLFTNAWSSLVCCRSQARHVPKQLEEYCERTSRPRYTLARASDAVVKR